MNLVAMASPGTVQASTGTSSIPAQGRVRLLDSTRVDTSGNGGGQITIRGGQIEVMGSNANADNYGSQDARGGIDIAGGTLRVSASTVTSDTYNWGKAGRVAMRARDIEVRNGTQIRSATRSQGNAGAVMVSGRDIQVQGDGKTTAISSSTFAQGHAGPVTIRADAKVLVSGTGALIASNANESFGHGGKVSVRAPDLEVRNGGRITVNTSSHGNAGTITVEADRLLVFGFGIFGLGTDELQNRYAAITSSAEEGSFGRGGQVSVMARDLEVRSGGQIATSTYSRGSAGDILIQADRMLLDGQGDSKSGIVSRALPGSAGLGGTIKISSDQIALANAAVISTESHSLANAGDITLHAGGSLQLINGATVTSTASQTDAGPITLAVGNSPRLTDSSITTQAQQGGGGQITLQAGRLIDLVGSRIVSSTFGPNATQNAGNITIDPLFLVLDHSSILARANRGRGGNISLTAGQIIRSPDSRIDASSERGISGRVDIRAPDQDVGRTLTPLPSAFLGAGALLPTACAARRGAGASSLTAARSARLPVGPDRPLLPSSLSYTGHRPPALGGPSGEATATVTPLPQAATLAAGRPRLSFACGI